MTRNLSLRRAASDDANAATSHAPPNHTSGGWWRHAVLDALIILAVVAPLAGTSTAHAAHPDDTPQCRCLDELSESDAIAPTVQREAEALVREYCDEDLPLELLSGGDRWLAQESCGLLHEAFVAALDLHDEHASASVGRGNELRLRVTALYRGLRQQAAGVTDWRHDRALLTELVWTIRPRR